MPKPTSLSAYARHRKLSVEAVSKAIRDGRLAESVVMVNGRPKITDVDRADKEWAANTRPGQRGTRPITRAKFAARDEERQAAGGDDSAQLDESAIDYGEARRRREIQVLRADRVKAEVAELELQVRRGELVAVADVRSEVEDAFARVRTHLLGVPSRARQRIHTLSAADVTLLEDLIREALEDLSLSGEREDEREAS